MLNDCLYSKLKGKEVGPLTLAQFELVEAAATHTGFYWISNSGAKRLHEPRMYIQAWPQGVLTHSDYIFTVTENGRQEQFELLTFKEFYKLL